MSVLSFYENSEVKGLPVPHEPKNALVPRGYFTPFLRKGFSGHTDFAGGWSYRLTHVRFSVRRYLEPDHRGFLKIFGIKLVYDDP